MDVPEYNREAWDEHVEDGNQWTVPVGPEVIEAARQGQWEVLLTDQKYVPRGVVSRDGGRRRSMSRLGRRPAGPTFAAAGANVTVLDNSPRQLAQDRFVAEREALDLGTVQGDAGDLSAPTRASTSSSTPSPTCSCRRSDPSGTRPFGCCEAGRPARRFPQPRCLYLRPRPRR